MSRVFDFFEPKMPFASKKFEGKWEGQVTYNVEVSRVSYELKCNFCCN